MVKPEEKELNEISSSEKNSPKNQSKNRGKKRKRLDSENSSDGDDVLPENTFAVETSLHASAIKNNLDEVSVKKILKKVVTNDHVLALVKLREEEEGSGSEEDQPKLTRAKAKELGKVSRNGVPWTLELTPIKQLPVKTRPEVTALIAQELPDDEDDEEYEPTPDDVMSDDDHIIESCSDLDSQPQTPATPQSQNKSSPKIVQDGPFKVPQEISSQVCKKLDLELDEEATIALRTRSKLSLSSTPIEHIESSFVPPDYLPLPDVDDLWNDFLKECLNPVSNARNEDDDETDPEYSVAADPDANEEDEEALENSIIKISKKELSGLMNELFHIVPAGIDKSLDDINGILSEGNNGEVKAIWEGKQEPLSDEESKTKSIAAKIPFDSRESMARFSIGKTEPDEISENDQTLTIDTDVNIKEVSQIVADENVPVTSVSEAMPVREVSAAAPKVTVTEDEREAEVAPPPPAPLRALLHAPPVTVNIQVEEAAEMYPQQLQLLQQQLRQHVQLAASNFLQLFVHPMHWSYAPKYKEYLVSLNKITLTNPKSVVNVCNLKPAIDLVESWESSMSENTPDTIAMVYPKEVEKCRRRTTQNSLYVGDFHELFKKVVANSSVFLYPYLLPPVPYRAEYHHKRFSYLPNEDALIVLGLDQFWWYVENNPQLFKRPARLHPRHRWGLATVARLVCKHMLPGVTPRALLSHVQTARKSAARDNPIVKYLENQIIEPVKHKLLPYNPKITLYEQPEFEMPRLWIKYLSKSNKRFKDHLYRRKCLQPAGVEIELGKTLESVEKQPLPIDFTKSISCNRGNICPPKPKPVLTDKIDVHIQNSNQTITPNTTIFVASNFYTIINTSTGTQLIPLQLQTSTVDSASTPICTPAIINTNVTQIDKTPEVDKSKNTEVTIQKTSKETNDGHCECCALLKKIRKKRQTVITDYFNCNKKQEKICGCEEKKYPKVTNKLKLLINNYKTLSKTVYNEVVTKIDKCKRGKMINPLDENGKTHDSNSKDLVSAIMFSIKLVERSNITRNTQIKRSLHVAFSKFDVENGDPVALSDHLFRIFDVELADMYREFMGFLTAEQAHKLDQFKEYFIRNCIEELVAKIEEQVLDNEKRQLILENIKEIILDNTLQPCGICRKLLNSARDYPALAEYIYSLFPHRRRKEKLQRKDDTRKDSETNAMEDFDKQEGALTICEEPNVTADYEADNSSSDEENLEIEEDVINNEDQLVRVQDQDSFSTTIKYEQPEVSEMTIDEPLCRRSESSDNMSMLIMSDDETFKEELPDWKREEDKIILEVLKQCISPEEMKDKTIIEIIEDKNIVNMIADSLSHKSFDDVRGRILYLLDILINDNDN